MITAEQLKDVMERADALNRYLDIDKKQMEYEEEDLRTQAPDFWDDPKRAEEQMKKVKALKSWIDGYKEVRTAADELQLAFDFHKDDMVTEEEVDADYSRAIKAIEALELKNMLRQKEDPMDCVMKINSGAGGTESQDWAQMLMRMYMRWAEAHGYKVTISNLQEGDEAGIKSVTMEIEGGEYAYGYLKSENGVHRLVRVSPFNAQGKRMTSFASVFVTPLVDDTIEVYERPHYYPDNVLLRYFKENKIRQYFTKAERLRPEMFTLYFNTTLAELPRIEPLNFPWDSTRYILQTNATLDTLHYWITDTLVSRVDSLQLAMTYLRTDSIFQLEETTDTLTIAMRKRNVRTKPGKEPQTPKADPLAFKTNGTGTFEIYNPLTLLMDEPLAAWDTAHIVLSEKADTLLKPLPYTWHVADSTGMNFAIRYPWEAEKSYVLDIDSATFRSIYGKANDRYSGNFKIRSLDEYSELKVVLTHYDSTAVIQVLDN